MRRAETEELFTVVCSEIKRETAKALLVEICGEDIWLPLSQVTDINRQTGQVTMTAWIAKEKGLR